ncbi:NnrU family protein [Oceanomicrobium pacificus]|uniref:NnrU domain-containing protein n=1 Tax=Oceanomicrobium pacificus TaxID=2692916 RepID=A0A6B0TPF2_9RHOB|nr:NnrU family protein [Oceanomicrobium pacificus]MXU64509.1 hypothetical protein [Oceanomicrobium pacificus]
MIYLVAGLILWSGAHLFKRVAPGARDGLIERIGAGPVRGVVALLLLLSVVLMVIGYRSYLAPQVYVTPGWTVHLNNLLMLIAVFLLGMGSSKGRARSWLRHPMLTGVLVWSVAHLLVNGDLASILLFGWLGVWAIVEMLVINAAEGAWERPAPGPASGDLRLVIISVVVFAVITTIHYFIGPSPFPT